MLWMCAARWKASGGPKTRVSRRVDSMLSSATMPSCFNHHIARAPVRHPIPFRECELESACVREPPPLDPGNSHAGVSRVLGWIFIASGFSALAYQIVLSRFVQLIVGGTAQAVSAILVAFMAGIALGSLLGGHWAERTRHPLRVYAIAELGIGVYAVAFPLLFPLFQDLYLALAPLPSGHPSAARQAVRFLAGVLAFIVPSTLMGMTTPAFARAVTTRVSDPGRALVRLYGWNTLGAAVGAFATAYLLVPAIGMGGTLALASAVNVVVAATAWFASRDTPPPVAVGPVRAAPIPLGLLTVVACTGVFTFALEVIWTHVLAILLGNSIYAFGLMLGCLLLGLYLGSAAARLLAEPDERARAAVGLSLAAAGAVVLLTLPRWSDVPALFLGMGTASPTFVKMEAVRFGVAFGLLVLPTALLGIAFPLVLSVATERGTRAARVGVVYAVNTAGAVAGALLGPYVLLPRLGSLLSLQLLGACLVALGGVAVAGLSTLRMRRVFGLVAASTLLWIWAWPITWDWDAMGSAPAVYLGRSGAAGGRIAFQEEDATGGLTTVVENRGVHTLLTNGKFQGDDSQELAIQHRLAHIPALFTAGRERALVVGLGTGVTLAAVAAHGYEQTVCAELNTPIIRAAREHFGHVNGRVLDRPEVKLLVEDGRSVLLESADRYDLVSVEITTLWFAGMGSIYSQEFYGMARSRLRRNGVLLQWFPVHHLSARNLYVVVNTVRSVFPYVSVWAHRHQGFVVASNEPLQVDLASVRADAARPALQAYFSELESGSPLELLSDLVVSDRDMDGFLDDMATLLNTDRSVVSTDSWPTLEYETPKDVLANFSYFQNRGLFERFRSRELPPFRGEATRTELLLARAAFGRGWPDARTIARSAELAREAPALSAAAADWALRQAGGGSAGMGDPVAVLGGTTPVLGLFAELQPGAACRPVQQPFTEKRGVPLLELDASTGESLRGTLPLAVLDGTLNPLLGAGWQVRAGTHAITLDLRLTLPRDRMTLAAQVVPLDDRAVFTRVLGRSEEGRWHPLTTGLDSDEAACNGIRVWSLRTSFPMTAVRLALDAGSPSNRIAIHEVWAGQLAP
jgi:spermidine synthase